MKTVVADLQVLYGQGMYRKVIDLVRGEGALDVRKAPDVEKLLVQAWSHHQLGEYDESIDLFKEIVIFWSPTTDVGESACRGLAHGILQRDNDVERADQVLRSLPAGRNRDNVRMNAFAAAAKLDNEIPAGETVAIIVNTLSRVPYATIDGHIVNNGAWALHNARGQEGVKPYLSVLPGFMFAALGIYGTTGATKNHVAGAMFRAAQICQAVGWKQFALVEARGSVALWQELVASQGGERYQQNLVGAQEVLKRLEEN